MTQIRISLNLSSIFYTAIGIANASITKNHLPNLKNISILIFFPWSVNLLPSKDHMIAAINKKMTE